MGPNYYTHHTVELKAVGRPTERKARDTRLVCDDLAEFRSRGGRGEAALCYTAHARYAPSSPTFRVPLCTSHANSADVFFYPTTPTVELLIAGSAGPNAARIMPKVHRE